MLKIYNHILNWYLLQDFFCLTGLALANILFFMKDSPGFVFSIGTTKPRFWDNLSNMRDPAGLDFHNSATPRLLFGCGTGTPSS